MKRHTTLTIDDEILKKAKQIGVNISDTAERAIAEKSGEVKFNVNDGDKCEFCGREDKRATANEPNKGLMWLWPDLKWICQSCFNFKSRNVPIGGGVHV